MSIVQSKGKALLLMSLLLCTFLSLNAQRNTYSPYSRYAYGLLHEPVMGQSVAMGGASYGLRSASYINPMNPASYSAIDTLTFLFGQSVAVQRTRPSRLELGLHARPFCDEISAFQTLGTGHGFV